MTVLQLNEQQAAMLRKVLSSYLGDLRMEISNTDSMAFRDNLKEEEQFIKELMERLAPLGDTWERSGAAT